MADFQEQLRQYRLQKSRRQAVESLKEKLRKFWMLGTGASTETTIDLPHTSPIKAKSESSNDEYLSTSEDEVVADPPPTSTDLREESKVLKYTLWAVYLLFWTTLFVIAIELKFGLVFLMLSALFGIYFNTRTGPKNRHEMSAYSVFNKNCESIDGTLKAEQFEREIRYGSGSVR